VAPPPERRRGRGWIVALVLVLLAAAGVAAYLIASGGGKVEIPPVAGLTQADAMSQLSSRGLDPRAMPVAHDTVPPGHVVDTEPPEGSEVDDGATVIVHVSSGPETADVPNVVGRPLEEAQAELEGAGFTVKTEEKADDDVEEGSVISQSATGEAPARSEITLTVSTGPESVKVPDVRLQTQSSAVDELRQNGLEPGNITPRPTAARPAGTVLEQNPGPTANVDRGTRVDLVVATPLLDVQVPSVIGLDAADAATKLQENGFTPISHGEVSAEPLGVVIGQEPQPGTPVSPGAEVRFTFSLGPGDSLGSPDQPSDQGPQ
jgi:serine/threonine-protein kinase